ncbi:MAG: DUF3179 domain-containing protein [Candidatus Hodarchaeales archaeon]|jgi:hypothetical protein
MKQRSVTGSLILIITAFSLVVGGLIFLNDGGGGDSNSKDLDDLLLNDEMTNKEPIPENLDNLTNNDNSDNDTIEFGALIDLLEETNSINYTQLKMLADNIVSGGPPPDGIPAIENPKYWTATDADSFLNEKDIVFGLNYNGYILAFPQRILAWHEIVNENVNGTKISITYCPLTGSAVGFHGLILNTTTTFGTSGKLVNSNLVMYDRDSDSNWPQILGNSVKGDYYGERLQKIQLIWTTWSLWKAEFPSTYVLSDDTGYFRNYHSDPYGSYLRNNSYYQTGGSYFPVLNSDSRLRNKDVVYGIDFNGEQLAIQKSFLRENKVINTAVGNQSIVVLYDNDLDTARVYSRVINGFELNFTYDNEQYVDNNGLIWDDRGNQNLTNIKLHEIVYFDVMWFALYFDVMWFAWVAYFPQTSLIF